MFKTKCPFQLKQSFILFTAARVCFPFCTKNGAKWGEELFFSSPLINIKFSWAVRMCLKSCSDNLCQGSEHLNWYLNIRHWLIPEYQNCVKCCFPFEIKPAHFSFILERFIGAHHQTQLLGPEERMAHPHPVFGVALGIHKSKVQHIRRIITSEAFSLCSFWVCRVFNCLVQHQGRCHLRTRSPLWPQGSAFPFPGGIFEQSQCCV